MRIYELAKELGINKKDLVAKVRNLGFPVSNFMSTIDPDSIPRIRAHMERERQANIEKVQVSKDVFRRRRKDRPGDAPAAIEYSEPMAQQPITLAAPPQSSADSHPELDATERFKLALEESLRQHLERSQPSNEPEESPAMDALRGRARRPRAEPLIEAVPSSRAADDEDRQPYDEEQGEARGRETDYDANSYAREDEPRFSFNLTDRDSQPAALRMPARSSVPANVPNLDRRELRELKDIKDRLERMEVREEVPLHKLREESTSQVRPLVAQEEPLRPWAAKPVLEQPVAPRHDEVRVVAAPEPLEQVATRPPQPIAPTSTSVASTVAQSEQAPAVRPAANQPPRQIRRPERTSTQEAVVVAIPSQEERDRRLGITPQSKATTAKAVKKGKTTLTRQDIYRDTPPGANRRVSKKKVTKAVGGKTAITVPSEHKRIVRIEDTISVSELAQRMAVKAGDLILALFKMGTKATITQSLDADTAALVASEFGWEVKNVAFQEDQVISEAEDRQEDLLFRAPVITMMGHVDHGKTSLLDKIRQTKVAQGEAGGITQHIGAYNVNLDADTRIVFLDTPGHEAFTAMRARGAQATDIVVLVVAANDGVMPQTVEAIHHAQDADVPIIVAINKVDLPGTNPDRIKQMLSEHGLVPEDWGGETMMVPVSAKTGAGIDDLLESIRIQAEVMELKANPDRKGSGVVLEATLESGRGPVATILVQQGTLSVGDIVVAGSTYGKVRAMTDERNRRLKSAEPSTPVVVVGLNEVPLAGDQFNVVADEKAARSLVEHRSSHLKKATTVARPSMAGGDLSSLLSGKLIKEVKLIVKGDVHGSVEAVREALTKLATDDVKVAVIHEGVGGVTEGDVMLASAAGGKSDATDVAIVAFNVRAKPRVLDLAASQGVRIKTYTIIYEAIEETKAMMAGMLAPITREKYLGRAEVRETFNIPKVGTIAGCTVQDGKIKRGARVRLLRNEVIIWEGRLASLRRFKDDVREVTQGFECGIGLENYNDVHLEDVIEAYETEEVAAEL